MRYIVAGRTDSALAVRHDELDIEGDGGRRRISSVCARTSSRSHVQQSASSGRVSSLAAYGNPTRFYVR